MRDFFNDRVIGSRMLNLEVSNRGRESSKLVLDPA